MESPISMTTGLRIRVKKEKKTCHARGIVRAPCFRGALEIEGKEPRMGGWRGGFGSAAWRDQGRSEGEGNDPSRRL